MTKFQPGDKVHVLEDNDCLTVVPHGNRRTGVVVSYAGPQVPAAFVGPHETLPKPSTPEYLVRMDDGAEESIPEPCLKLL